MRDIDLKSLDPGIVSTVILLRAYGFETTDSGDGETKPEEYRTIPGPHVVVQVPANDLVREADRLLDVLKTCKASISSIEASYSPLDGVALIVLCGRV